MQRPFRADNPSAEPLRRGGSYSQGAGPIADMR